MFDMRVAVTEDHKVTTACTARDTTHADIMHPHGSVWRRGSSPGSMLQDQAAAWI